VITILGGMRELAALPKAHLHVHLESTVRPDTLRELAAANGLPVPPARPASYHGFRPFADYNGLLRASLVTAADFTRVAREFCADEAASGVRYAEVMFTAASHGDRLGHPEMPLEAVLAGVAEGRRYGIEVRVLLDHSRRRGVDRFRRTVALAGRYDGVVGVGMAGEEWHPLAPYADALAEAADAGVAMAHHAGEMCGPDSIREAITVGRADRLGHGIRILDDPALVDEVRGRGIPLEVCPTSNVALGLVPSLAGHPLPRLRDAGLAVTLNTDIPAAVGTDLTREYALVRETFGYDDAALAGLAAAGVDASFAPEPTKARLRAEISAWLAVATVAG
jgi:adenosine deaminase